MILPTWLLAIGKGLLGFLRGVPWQVWAGLALIAALWWWGNSREADGYATAKAAGDEAMRSLLAGIELDRTLAEAEARATEARHRAEIDAIAAHYAEEMSDAQARADAVVADLRAGTVRLRQHWQGCENAAARVPATPAAPAGPDAGAELRAAGARDLVRAAAECDATIRGLQSVIREGLGQEGE